MRVIQVTLGLALYLVNMSPSLILISVVDGGIKCNPIATKSNIRIHTYIQPEVRARGQSRSIQPEVRAGARAPSINTASQPDAAVPVSVSINTASQPVSQRLEPESEPEQTHTYLSTNVANGYFII